MKLISLALVCLSLASCETVTTINADGSTTTTKKIDMVAFGRGADTLDRIIVTSSK